MKLTRFVFVCLRSNTQAWLADHQVAPTSSNKVQQAGGQLCAWVQGHQLVHILL
jgi:hypothetical protein